MYNDGEILHQDRYNVKNGIFQVTSASKGAAFETSFKLSTGGEAVLPPGAIMPQVTLRDPHTEHIVIIFDEFIRRFLPHELLLILTG